MRKIFLKRELINYVLFNFANVFSPTLTKIVKLKKGTRDFTEAKVEIIV